MVGYNKVHVHLPAVQQCSSAPRGGRGVSCHSISAARAVGRYTRALSFITRFLIAPPPTSPPSPSPLAALISPTAEAARLDCLIYKYYTRSGLLYLSHILSLSSFFFVSWLWPLRGSLLRKSIIYGKIFEDPRLFSPLFDQRIFRSWVASFLLGCAGNYWAWEYSKIWIFELAAPFCRINTILKTCCHRFSEALL